jgi:hypothetical protein
MTRRVKRNIPVIAIGGVFFLAPTAFTAAQEPIAVGEEFQVNTHTTSSQGRSDISVASDGHFVAIWNSGDDQDGSGSGVFGQRFAANGVRSGDEFQINTYTTDDQWGGSVTVGPTGDFLVVWASYGGDGSSSGVFGQLYSADGLPMGTEFLVNAYTTGPQKAPAIDSDGDGNFIVVWDEAAIMDPNARNRVFGQRLSSSGVPLGSELPLGSDESWRGDVAVAPSGQFVVVWQRTYYRMPALRIFGRRFAADGSPLGEEFQVNNSTNDYYFVQPKVAVQPGGDFLVVWEDWASGDGSSAGVLARKYAADGSPESDEFQVNTFTTGYQRFPAATVSPEGGFVVVWSSYYQDGSYDGIFGRGLRGDGTPVSNEFQVNTYTTENQTLPAIASNDRGDTVVVWNSWKQEGGSDWGIFGQRFALPIFASNFESGDFGDWIVFPLVP